MPEISGQCLCGAVRVTAQTDNPILRACHCEMCRRHTSGAFFSIETVPGSVTVTGDAVTYRSSEWAQRGLIMAAMAYHRDRDYEAARASAQRYLDFYPTGEDAAYAQYLLAISYYDQIDEIGRDQGLTFQALQALREVIEEYPDTEYARSSILKFDLAFDHLAGKEMEIGRYYLKRGHYAASINRFRVVVEDFQTTTHTPEALMRLVEAYLALGLTDEAQTAGAILGYNFQSSPFYQDAYAQLRGRGLTATAQGNSWLTNVYRQVIQGKWL